MSSTTSASRARSPSLQASSLTGDSQLVPTTLLSRKHPPCRADWHHFTHSQPLRRVLNPCELGVAVASADEILTNPSANGKVITSVAEGTAKDVDRAVQVARHAFETLWGFKVSAAERGKLLNRLADLIEKHADELAALEALDNGKTFGWAKAADLDMSISTIRYYAGWADKIHGQVIETSEDKLSYTRHEPFGVVGQIIPWNFPCMSSLRIFSLRLSLSATGQC